MRAAILGAILVAIAAAGPCDILAAAGTPCVAAHSTVRALYAAYNGPLYEVNRTVDGVRFDVGVLPGGYANASAQDAMCGSNASSVGLPPLGTVVNLVPVSLPALSFRHCDAQGFVTDTDGNDDHAFTLVAALNGDAGAISFRSVNYPQWYIAPVTTSEPGRLGIVQAPIAADASWVATPAAGAAVTLTLASRGLAAAVGGNLTGSCAANYGPPAASVYLQAQGSEWLLNKVVPVGPPACTITKIYDQSPQHNDISVAPAGGAVRHGDQPVDASRLRITVNGHAVYGAYFTGGQGYRIDNTTGVARGNDPETIYMVTSGKHYNSGCCFDYGNAESDNFDDGAGTMEAVYFGSWSAEHNGGWCGGAGDNGTAQAGPWVMADLENGLWACGTPASSNPNVFPARFDFVTAMVKGGSSGFGLKQGDATAGLLNKTYEGARPPGYQPMQKQGSIILGIGGDNSNAAVGSFFEGVRACIDV